MGDGGQGLLWDGFWYEPCPRCRIDHATGSPTVQCAANMLQPAPIKHSNYLITLSSAWYLGDAKYIENGMLPKGGCEWEENMFIFVSRSREEERVGVGGWGGAAG